MRRVAVSLVLCLSAAVCAGFVPVETPPPPDAPPPPVEQRTPLDEPGPDTRLVGDFPDGTRVLVNFVTDPTTQEERMVLCCSGDTPAANKAKCEALGEKYRQRTGGGTP